jgi:hypothetical protein
LDVAFRLMSEAEAPSPFTGPLDSVRKSRFWVFEDGDFTSEADINALIELLFNYPEDSFYLYSEEHASGNALVSSVAHFGIVRVIESQAFYYRHPKFKRDFVRIQEPSIEWEWERQAKEQGPMFIRHELRLSERGKRELEQSQLLRRQKEEQEVERIRKSPDNPLKLEPNFMGIGVDLPKAWRWLRRWAGKK